MTHPRPRKRFGQHFLHDENILDKIMTAVAPESGQHFVEIGPGRGALTVRIAELAGRLDVIEIDRELAAAMTSVVSSPALVVHECDALVFDFSALPHEPARLRLVGNLPYNISTPLLFHLLDFADLFADLHVMLQKEVALRIAAMPGTKTYGRLSVAVAARCNIDLLFNIRPGSFTPPPRVDSSFIRLVPDADKRDRIHDPAAFDRILRAAFGQRRKRLSNALHGLLSQEEICAAGVDPAQRAEQLDVDQFVALGNRLTTTE